MSYDIFYDKQFVKVPQENKEDLFIPMVLAGSSNCYDLNDRRERSWFNFGFLLNNKLAGTQEQMLAKQAETRANKIEQYEDYKDSSFGYFTSLSIGGGGCNATYGQYLGITKTGCKKSLTVEQLREEGIGLHIRTPRYGNADEVLEEKGIAPLSFSPKTTQDLINFLENIAPKYEDITVLSADFSGMFDEAPTRLRRKYFPTKKAEKQEIKSSIGYTIEAKKDGGPIGYLYSYKGGSFRYSQHKDHFGKQFLNKKEAQKLADKMNKRRSDCKFTVVQANYGTERTFYVPVGKKATLPVKEKAKKRKMSDSEFILSLELPKEGQEIANFFDPSAKCFLDPIGVALHDVVKGAERLGDYTTMEQGLRLFREKYPEEYYVLLD
jgi:hypothetical protein